MASDHNTPYIQYLKRLFLKRYFEDLVSFLCVGFPTKWNWLKYNTTDEARAATYTETTKEKVDELTAVYEEAGEIQTLEGVKKLYKRHIITQFGKKYYDTSHFSLYLRGNYCGMAQADREGIYRAAATFLSLADTESRNEANWLDSLRTIMIPGVADQTSNAKSLSAFDPMFKFLMSSFDKTQHVCLDGLELSKQIKRFGQVLKSKSFDKDSPWHFEHLSYISAKHTPHADLARNLRNQFEAHDNPAYKSLEDVELFTLFTGISIVYSIQKEIGGKTVRSCHIPEGLMIKCFVPEGYIIDNAKKRDDYFLLMPYREYTFRKPGKSSPIATIKFNPDWESVTLTPDGRATNPHYVYMPETEADRKINELLGKILKEESSSKASASTEEIKKILDDALALAQKENSEAAERYINEIAELFRPSASLINTVENIDATTTDTNTTVTRVEEKTDKINVGLDNLTRAINELKGVDDPPPPAPSRLPRILKACGIAALAVLIIAAIPFCIYLHKTDTPLRYGWMVHAASFLGNVDAPYIKACEEERLAQELMLEWLGKINESGILNYEHHRYLDQSNLSDKIRSSAKWYRRAIERYTSEVEADSAANSDRAIRTALMLFTGKGGEIDVKKALYLAKKASPLHNQGLVALLSLYLGDRHTSKDILESLEYNDRPLDDYGLLTKTIIDIQGDTIGTNHEKNAQILRRLAGSSDQFVAYISTEASSDISRGGYYIKDGKFFIPLIERSLTIHILASNLFLSAVIEFAETGLDLNGQNPLAHDFLRIAWDLGNTRVAPLLQELSKDGNMDISDIKDEVYVCSKKLAEDTTRWSYALLNDIKRLKHYGHTDKALSTFKTGLSSIKKEALTDSEIKFFEQLFLELGGEATIIIDSTAPPLDSLKLDAIYKYFDGWLYAKGYNNFKKDSIKSDSLIRLAAAQGIPIAKKYVAQKILYDSIVVRGQHFGFNYKIRSISLPDFDILEHASNQVGILGNIDINESDYFAALDSAKILLTEAAEAGDTESQSLMAFICDQQGDKAGFKKWHKLALDKYDICAVTYEVLGHDYLTESDTVRLDNDIILLQNAISLDNYKHPLQLLNALQRLCILLSKGRSLPTYQAQAEDLFGNFAHCLTLSGTPKIVTNARKAELMYCRTFDCLLGGQITEALSYLTNYACFALDKWIAGTGDFEYLNIQNTWGPKLSDPERIYAFINEYFPSAEWGIISLMGRDPFIEARKSIGNNHIGAPTLSSFGTPQLLLLSLWDTYYPLPYYDIIPDIIND